MSKISHPSLHYNVPKSILRQTLTFLRSQGSRDLEAVLFWGGTVIDRTCHICALLIPAQEGSMFSFRIPDVELVKIITWSADHNIVLAVQVHSHPAEAFHSEADDHHAVLQHLHAISIVVPDFGNIRENAFFHDAAIYSLESRAQWQPLKSADIHHRFVITDALHEMDYPPSSHTDHH